MCSRAVVMRLRNLIEPLRRSFTMKVMAEYSYLVLYLPRGMPRDAARRILTDQIGRAHV